MNILLHPNLERENGLWCTQQTVEVLRALGAVPMMDELFRETFSGADCVFGRFADLLARCDVIVPIGGDGTIMRAARRSMGSGKPILGINAGRVGFLTQLEPDELQNLRLLVEGNYTQEDRMMLEAELPHGEKPRRYKALNDIVVSRSDADRIMDIHVNSGELLIAKHRADGLIFATPTGSTAYSLSAGGPIVDPNLSLLLLTAICSHTTFSRSMALSACEEYTVTDHSADNPKGLAVAVDGRRVGRLCAGQTLRIRRSVSTMRFIDLGLRSFYDNVNEKLSWGR